MSSRTNRLEKMYGQELEKRAKKIVVRERK